MTGKKFRREKIQLDFYILSAALDRFRMKRQTESRLWSHEKSKINTNNPLSQNLLSTVSEHLGATLHTFSSKNLLVAGKQVQKCRSSSQRAL